MIQLFPKTPTSNTTTEGALKKRILPDGFYTVEDVTSEGYKIRIRQGTFNGVTIFLNGQIKIREEVLTGTPQLLYTSKILDSAGHPDLESSVSLSRIIAAMAVELSDATGAEIESV